MANQTPEAYLIGKDYERHLERRERADWRWCILLWCAVSAVGFYLLCVLSEWAYAWTATCALWLAPGVGRVLAWWGWR